MKQLTKQRYGFGTASWCAGLGSGKGRHQLVQDEIQVEVEEERSSKMGGRYKQGVWTRWEHMEQHKIT